MTIRSLCLGLAALCAMGGRAAPPPYRPSGPETGLYGAATGFFHMESIDGRDWPIDPTGRAVILAGCQHVKVQGVFCEALGHSPYGRFIETNYPSREVWADECLARLSDWGFTFLGNACTIDLLGHRTLPHVRNLRLGTRFATGDPDRYIRKHLNAPCTALPNVWHPGFAAECERIAAKECADERDDPWLIGWFIDNELAWWGTTRRALATGLYDAVAALPPEHSARKELDRFLAERGLSTTSCGKSLAALPVPPVGGPEGGAATAFLRHYARTYFEITTAAIRKADPNHMILGSRYAGLDGAHPVVWEEAGRYCDIVTFNCYPWADLDRGVVLDKRGGVPMAERFREYHGYAQKPLMVTEWSFVGLDTGRPCTYGAGQRFYTQRERAEATRLFARTMLADPHLAGYDYFMWADEPALGVRASHPEDCNYGLVNEEGVPYPEITAVFKALHGDLVKWRTVCGTLPQPVAAAEEDGAFVISNGLVRISGALGAPHLAQVAFTGDGGARSHLGYFGALLAGEERGTNYWRDVERLDAFSLSRDEATGAESVILRGVSDRADFAITARLTLAPGSREVSAELLSLENTGAAPLAVRLLFMRLFPADADAMAARPGTPPNVWHGPNEGSWRLADGSRIGLATDDPAAGTFNFWRRVRDGSLHPDAPFRLGHMVGDSSTADASAMIIPPGAAYVPPVPFAARLFLRK